MIPLAGQIMRLTIGGIYMTSFHYSANLRYNLDILEFCPVRGDPHYTVPASIFEAKVIRVTSFFSLFSVAITELLVLRGGGYV